ncbi:MAG: tRNA lysidine(34) synthetase TilS [Alphaproteobacteria bacterium]|uniref:tRNA lysidine(34) synthetase TilS n=1 Tax=Maricaulis alexandrii TaxID=2570354 RepID=UPI001486A238|nr:tRNA lysidine(34) synthetase TilS [Maricaulis alexandrii]MCR9266960.1 tRNA lysidine(34) synthetase TilS [Alphaproteobacteria bacterium]
MTATPETRVHSWLDRHVMDTGPVALACSGGSDSTALLLMAASWAKARGRRLHILTLDHGLRPEAHSEAKSVAARARDLGLSCDILAWTGDKPETGLQAAARAARHRLFATACRRRGIRELLLGHTLDDQAETVWMRLEAGGNWRSCTGMVPVGPSPLWPQGRDLRLLRPLLDHRRAELRAWLTAQGESWIDDPSNADEAYTRIRIRRHLETLEAGGFRPERLARLAEDLRAVQDEEDRCAAAQARRCVRFAPWGGVRLDRRCFRAAPEAVRLRLWDALALAVSGQSGLPDRKALMQLDRALSSGVRTTAAGVLLDGGDKAWLVRDPGAVLGRVDRHASNRLTGEGDDPVWDGRFSLRDVSAPVMAGVLGRGYDGLADRSILGSVPAAARPGLLALRRDGEVIALPGLGGDSREGGIAQPLFLHRFCTRLLPAEPPVWFDTSESLQPVLQ